MSKKTLNIANLQELGADRLAVLLMEVSTGSADIKRRLRLEISHNLGAAELAQDVRKRLVTLRKSTSFVGWRKRKALIKDLTVQVAMIVDKIAPDDPTIAFDLLWQFNEIAPSIYGRVDDSKGDVGDMFRTAIAHFDDIAGRAIVDSDTLADRVWIALQDNDYGEWDGIIERVAPALGTSGFARLTMHVQAYGAAPIDAGSDDHDAIKFLRELRGGESYAADHKARFVKETLQEIASVSGDTNAYIAQYSPSDLQRKDIAADAAMLLLDDGQADAALALLLGADQDGSADAQTLWDTAYIACLTALERVEDAQAHRWACFTATLTVQHLRDYLALLPDFEDVEAEDRAKRHVLSYPSLPAALAFCLSWPDLVTANQLIETRIDDLAGGPHALFINAVEALRVRHPRAAALLLRTMIDDILDHGQSFRYDTAADHLADCTALDVQIADYGAFPTHAQNLDDLQTRHSEKSSFWTQVR